MGKTRKDHYAARDILTFSKDREDADNAAAMQAADDVALLMDLGYSRKAAEHFVGRLGASGQ